MKKQQPPYYPNWDNTHCVQCCLRGVLEAFEPEKVWSWDELDAFTGKELGKWTWPYRVWLNMAQRGYDVRTTTSAKLKDYLTLGVYKALVKNRGQAAADKQREMANFGTVESDLHAYWQAIQDGKIVRDERLPRLDELRALLDTGYLLMCSLNYRAFYHKEGYASHSVLVYDIDDQHVYFHDPEHAPETLGLVTHQHFEHACTSPTPAQWLVTAYKLKN